MSSESGETESREGFQMAGCCNVEDVVEFICSKLEGKPICEDVRNHLLSISPTDFKENQTATEG